MGVRPQQVTGGQKQSEAPGIPWVLLRTTVFIWSGDCSLPVSLWPAEVIASHSLLPAQPPHLGEYFIH